MSCPIARDASTQALLLRGVLAALLANLVVYVLLTDNGVIRNDYRRFVALVDDFHTGTLTFAKMLEPVNGPFKSLAIPGLILADGVLFDLELRGLHVLSVVLLFLASLLVVARLTERPHSILVGVAIATTLLSAKLTHLLGHGQASLSIVRVASFLAAFWALDRVFYRPSRPRTLAAVAWITLAIFCGHSSLPAFGIALGVVLASQLVVARQRTTWLLAVTTTAALGVFLATMTIPHATAETRELWRQSPLDVIAFALHLAGQSVSPTHKVATSTLVVGATAFAWMALSVLAFFRFRVWRESWLPLALLVYSPAVMGLITLARVETGPGGALARRYFADTPLWQVGALWVLACIGPQIPDPRRQRAVAAAASGLALVFIAIQGYRIEEQWDRVEETAAAFDAQATLLRNAASLPDEVLFARMGLADNRRLQGYVRGGLEIMERRRLNVFRE